MLDNRKKDTEAALRHLKRIADPLRPLRKALKAMQQAYDAAEAEDKEALLPLLNKKKKQLEDAIKAQAEQ